MRHFLVPLAALALVAGCTPDGAPTGSPSVFPSPTVAASPSPTPSPSPSAVESFPPAPATESPEQAAIRAAWMEYWRIHHKFTGDPTLSDLTETQQITAGEQQNQILDLIGNLRDQRLRVIGGLEFRDIVVGQPAADGQDARTAVVTYCLDRRNLMLENYATGEALKAPGAPTFREETTLTEGLDSRWRVLMIRNEEAAC